MSQSENPLGFFLDKGYTVYKRDYDNASSGANGFVYPALRNSDGKKVAIKSVKKYVKNANGQKSYFNEYFIEKEADILHALTNPSDEKQSSTCKLLGSLCLLDMWSTDRTYYFVTPWIDGPSLTRWIYSVYKILPANVEKNPAHPWVEMYKRGEITEYGLNKAILYLMYELSNTVKGLHDQNIAHSDLKPDNIHVSAKSCLLQLKNGFNPLTFSCHLVILDFGLSCLFNAVKSDDKCYATTPMMNAPETWGMKEDEYHANVKNQDVFSLGLVIAWMGMGYHPYHNKNSTDQSLKESSKEAGYLIDTGIAELDIILEDNALTNNPNKRDLNELVSSLKSLYTRYNEDHIKKHNTLILLEPLLGQLDKHLSYP